VLAAAALGVALAMDAFAVALGQGAHFRPGLKTATATALVFGAAQGAMLLTGWTIGSFALPIIFTIDHWIAFLLLTGLGVWMIYAVEKHEEPQLTGTTLLLAAIATSVDALAAGITLPTMSLPPIETAAIIALITAAMSAIGVVLGRELGDRFGRPAEILGGLILIGLGVKILAEHTGMLA